MYVFANTWNIAVQFMPWRYILYHVQELSFEKGDVIVIVSELLEVRGMGGGGVWGEEWYGGGEMWLWLPVSCGGKGQEVLIAVISVLFQFRF